MNPRQRIQMLTRRPRAEAPAPRVDGSVATVRLYDVIDSYGDWFGVSAAEFAGMLDALPPAVTEIRVHINSAGGDVFDAVAIVNALAAHPARVVAVVDGLAASSASFIAVTADEAVMAPFSEMMIHDAWGVCAGDAAEMTAMATMLDGISQNIASIYAEKAGGTADGWRAAMTTETWYAADEAVAAGLADRVGTTDDTPDAGQPGNRLDLSMFKFEGRANAPRPEVAGPKVDEPSPEGEEQDQPAAAFRRPLLHLHA